ncbi:MAG: caspase family protein [Fimbriimonadaceae bacterium]
MNKLFRTMAVAVLATAALAVQSATYALFVGINDYPDVVDEQGNRVRGDDGQFLDDDLRGAVNDAKVMREIVTSRFGVPLANTRMLTDKEANKDNFVANMKWLIQSAKPGDQVVFFFSGHGVSIPVVDSKEEDGKEEAVVLADGSLVVDDLFGDVARMLSNAGIHSTFMFDSCYSGGMSRNGKVKFLDYRTRQHYLKSVEPAVLSPLAKAETFRLQPRQATTPRGEFAFFLASQEDKPAIDISGVKDLDPHGVFTLVLSSVLADEPGISSRNLIEAVKKLLEELKFDQGPNAEFSTPARAEKPFSVKT